MDVICAKCAEPWDSYELRNPGDCFADKQEVADFRAGKGCPSCDWGHRVPARTGQTYEATTDRVYKIAKGQKVKIHDILNESWMVFTWPEDENDYKGDPWNPLYIVETEDGTQLPFRYKSFFSFFKLVPNQSDIEQREDLKIEAAESECGVSDEDPLLILERRGII